MVAIMMENQDNYNGHWWMIMWWVIMKIMELMTIMNDMMMVSDNNNGAFVFLCLPCGKCTGRRSIFCQNIVTMMMMTTTMMMVMAIQFRNNWKRDGVTLIHGPWGSGNLPQASECNFSFIHNTWKVDKRLLNLKKNLFFGRPVLSLTQGIGRW